MEKEFVDPDMAAGRVYYNSVANFTGSTAEGLYKYIDM
jgi:hypothetical protein